MSWSVFGQLRNSLVKTITGSDSPLESSESNEVNYDTNRVLKLAQDATSAFFNKNNPLAESEFSSGVEKDQGHQTTENLDSKSQQSLFNLSPSPFLDPRWPFQDQLIHLKTASAHSNPPLQEWITYLAREDGILRFRIVEQDQETMNEQQTDSHITSIISESNNMSPSRQNETLLKLTSIQDLLQATNNGNYQYDLSNQQTLQKLSTICPFLTYRGLFLFSEALIPNLLENPEVKDKDFLDLFEYCCDCPEIFQSQQQIEKLRNLIASKVVPALKWDSVIRDILQQEDTNQSSGQTQSNESQNKNPNIALHLSLFKDTKTILKACLDANRELFKKLLKTDPLSDGLSWHVYNQGQRCSDMEQEAQNDMMNSVGYSGVRQYVQEIEVREGIMKEQLIVNSQSSKTQSQQSEDSQQNFQTTVTNNVTSSLPPLPLSLPAQDRNISILTYFDTPNFITPYRNLCNLNNLYAKTRTSIQQETWRVSQRKEEQKRVEGFIREGCQKLLQVDQDQQGSNDNVNVNHNDNLNLSGTIHHLKQRIQQAKTIQEQESEQVLSKLKQESDTAEQNFIDSKVDQEIIDLESQLTGLNGQLNEVLSGIAERRQKREWLLKKAEQAKERHEQKCKQLTLDHQVNIDPLKKYQIICCSMNKNKNLKSQSKKDKDSETPLRMDVATLSRPRGTLSEEATKFTENELRIKLRETCDMLLECISERIYEPIVVSGSGKNSSKTNSRRSKDSKSSDSESQTIMKHQTIPLAPLLSNHILALSQMDSEFTKHIQQSVTQLPAFGRDILEITEAAYDKCYTIQFQNAGNTNDSESSDSSDTRQKQTLLNLMDQKSFRSWALEDALKVLKTKTKSLETVTDSEAENTNVTVINTLIHILTNQLQQHQYSNSTTTKTQYYSGFYFVLNKCLSFEEERRISFCLDRLEAATRLVERWDAAIGTGPAAESVTVTQDTQQTSIQLPSEGSKGSPQKNLKELDAFSKALEKVQTELEEKTVQQESQLSESQEESKTSQSEPNQNLIQNQNLRLIQQAEDFFRTCWDECETAFGDISVWKWVVNIDGAVDKILEKASSMKKKNNKLEVFSVLDEEDEEDENKENLNKSDKQKEVNASSTAKTNIQADADSDSQTQSQEDFLSSIINEDTSYLLDLTMTEKKQMRERWELLLDRRARVWDRMQIRNNNKNGS